MIVDNIRESSVRVKTEQGEHAHVLIYTPRGVVTVGVENDFTYGTRINLSPTPTMGKINVDHFAGFYTVSPIEGDEPRPWQQGPWQAIPAPLPCVEECQRERAEGSGGCGACALCCKEARDERDEARAVALGTTAMLAEARAVAAEWREAKEQEEAAHRTEINDAIRERDDARDEAAMLGDLVIALANTTDAGHAVAYPLHIAEPVESCAVCQLLERARRWAR